MICAAEIDIDRGRLEQARDKAAEALALVTVLGRASIAFWWMKRVMNSCSPSSTMSSTLAIPSSASEARSRSCAGVHRP